MNSEKLQMTKMTEEYAVEISTWKYEDEYKIYNMPTWEEMVEDEWALADEGKRGSDYLAFLTAGGKLAAFTRHTAQDGGFMLGVGVNPDSLSLGYGSEAIRQTVAYLVDLNPGADIFLDVRIWNKRAVKSYEKAGFAIRETIEQETHAGKGRFYRMSYMK